MEPEPETEKAGYDGPMMRMERKGVTVDAPAGEEEGRRSRRRSGGRVED